MTAAPAAALPERLRACCGSRSWVAGMLAAVPFADSGALLETAERVWWSLGPQDWREAFAAHPRIGDRPPAGSQEQREQAAAETADPAVLAALAEGNRAYEARFGMTYVVRARGRSAQEMLALLRSRLLADPGLELRAAAEQQAEITDLRLRALLAEHPQGLLA